MTSRCLLNLLILIVIVDGQDKICIQCATPNFKENWAATGLPKIPSGLKWDKDCAVVPIEHRTDDLWRSSNCASSCFEILLPIDGIYGVVRGCHEFFVYDEMKVIMTNDTVVCELNEVEGYGSVMFQGATTPFTKAFAGTSFITPFDTSETDTTKMNLVLTSGDVGDVRVNRCHAGTQKTCKSCSEYDGTGSCSASTGNTCKGVYCTKTSGKLNGHFYESRGCSTFNPFAKDVCSWTEQTFNVTTGANGVELGFRANQCFCQGELCNSSPLLTSSLIFPLVFSTFLLFS